MTMAHFPISSMALRVRPLLSRFDDGGGVVTLTGLQLPA